MKLILPSHGLCGQKWVNVKQATMRTLHDLQDYNNDEFLRKYFLVESLTDANMDKISAMDMDYIYTFIVFALLLNSAKFTLKCKHCKKNYEHIVGIEDLEIIEVPKRSRRTHVRYYNLKKYKFSLLSAQQLHDAYMKAQYEDDDKVDNVFITYQVAQTLGMPMAKDLVNSLPLNIYTAAYAYQRYLYHGFSPKITVKCKECGKEHSFKFSISSKATEISPSSLMQKYLDVASVLSFDDFLNFTIVDYNHLVELMNKSNG